MPPNPPERRMKMSTATTTDKARSRSKKATSGDRVKAKARVNRNRRCGELLTPLKAIRSRCLDCCGGSSKEVALCPVTSCPLWPYRFGTRKRARKIVGEERALDDAPADYWAEELDDYTSQAQHPG